MKVRKEHIDEIETRLEDHIVLCKLFDLLV